MARGYNASADIIRTLADGTDLNQIWDEFSETLDIVNTQRSALAELFTFRTTLKGETILQQPSGSSDFEEASEYGVPQGLRVTTDLLPLGYTFSWYDLGNKTTWRALADMSSSQITALHSAALEADNRLTFKKIMGRLFSPVAAANEDGTAVYGLWNGSDTQTPPTYNGNTFSSSHSHYLTSGSSSLDPSDVELLTETVLHHGYADGDGQRLIILANPREAEVIASYRAGVNGAKFDFIPSAGAPPYLTAETLVGPRPPESFEGLKVLGQYGRALIVENYLIPLGYLASVATGGADSERNPIAFREHSNPNVRGLRIIPGNVGAYPLIDSWYARGFGVGVRHRGAAAVMQVTASSTYTAPTL